MLAKTFEKYELNFSQSALFHIKTRVNLKYFGNDSRLILFSEEIYSTYHKNTASFSGLLQYIL